MPETAPPSLGRRPARGSAAPGVAAAAIGLFFGLLFALLTPPFEAPDEDRHFRRAYLISEGDRLVAGPGGVPGAYLPASVETLISSTLQGIPETPGKRLRPGTARTALAIPLAPARRAFVAAADLTSYPPVAYGPQALAVLLGRAAGARPLVLLYLARLANLAACLALAVLAVSIAPCCRWLLAVLALVPMAVFLRASASPDGLTDAAGLLLAAAVLAAMHGPAAARARDLLAAAAAAALVAFSKSGYFLLPLALLAVPAACLGSRRRARSVRAAAVALAVLGALASWRAARGYIGMRPGVAIDPAAQTAGMRAAPFHFLGLALADYAAHFERYAVGFIGNLGWLSVPLPALALLVYGSLLLVLALVDGPEGVTFLRRAFLLALAASTLLLISASQYLVWTAVGAAEIEGVQGRYFLPLAPLAALALGSRRLRRDLSGPRAAWTLALVLFACEAAALIKMWVRFYG